MWAVLHGTVCCNIFALIVRNKKNNYQTFEQFWRSLYVFKLNRPVHVHITTSFHKESPPRSSRRSECKGVSKKWKVAVMRRPRWYKQVMNLLAICAGSVS